RRPLVVAETGAQGEARGPWLAHIGDEVRSAQRAGIPILGVCLYPVLDYPGWDNDRHCEVGLWGYADESGERPPHRPPAEELRRQQQLTSYVHPVDPPAGPAPFSPQERALATHP